ncbi:S8 family serine peptidase [Kribbella sancticallisti]|uniref:S8 family serine peptidase n=1 Tax=Kribbella sancticallisti TaxID=460087 RepID=UPI0031DFAE32
MLRLGVPAALIAATLVTLTGSSGSAADPKFHRPAFTAKKSAEFEPNSVLVKFKKNATSSARKSAVSKFRTTTEDSVASNIVKLKGEASAPELLKKVQADPTVELASLNYKRWVSAVPNDPYYNSYQKTSLTTARVPQAWDVSKTTGNQIVAVLDTGVDAGHPDLVGRLVPGYNATSPNRGPIDDHGHGTMTLGIIAANANNGVGVAGVGWTTKAMPVKVLASDGSGWDADIAEGIDWAVAHGAKVINLSLGGPGFDGVLADAVKRAYDKGVVVVAAAGNDGNGVPQYPAAFPEVIAVGATNPTGALTDFSTFGDWVDIAAPGWDILTTGPRALTEPGYEPYRFCTGTSCSAPIVAGVAALVKNKWPTFTSAQVAQRLKVLSRDAGPRGTDPYYGAGILDAYAALGGRFAPDFPGGVADGNYQPARAIKITGSASGTIDTEGDVDWYAIESAADRKLQVSVTGPTFDVVNHSTNVGPAVDVYKQDLRWLGTAEKSFPENVDPDTGIPLSEQLVATTNVSATAGTTYISVRNANGSRDARQYQLSVTEAGNGGTMPGSGYPVRDVEPATLSTTAAVAVKPTVTFSRPVLGSTVDSTTVKLFHGRTGALIPSTVTFAADPDRAVITPAAPLLDNTPYKIDVYGIHDASSLVINPFTSVFRTADLAPQKLTTFTASGAYRAAYVSWTVPATPDLDQVIIRQNVGGRAPSLTTGTLVYAGTGSAAVKVTGLAAATTYTYAGWVKDRSGKVSPISAKAVSGVKSGISTTSTAITYGGTITLRGSVLRIDNKAYAGLPVQLYGRAKNVSALKLIASLKTSSTGTVNYAYKPTTSSVFTMVFVGNADLMGTRTADINVAVAPAITATLAPTAIRLGQVTKFSGYVAPAHYGKPVYLQYYSAKTWRTIASVKLSASGAYAFGIKPATRGSFAYRVLFTADADHAQAITPYKIVTVS